VAVHLAELLEVWVFGDFQSPRLSPDEPLRQIQRIEASHLVPVLTTPAGATRATAFVASLFVTLTSVYLVASYAYPDLTASSMGSAASSKNA
jgi:hypothetical protein